MWGSTSINLWAIPLTIPSLFPDQSIQMATELWIQATEPPAGTSWTPMLLSHRYATIIASLAVVLFLCQNYTEGKLWSFISRLILKTIAQHLTCSFYHFGR